MADNILYLKGRGGQNTTHACLTDADFISSGQEAIYQFAVAPRTQTLERYWVISGISSGSTARTGVGVTSDGSYSTPSTASFGRVETHFVMQESIIDPANTPTVEYVSFSATIPATEKVRFNSIGCYEAPRFKLDHATLTDDAPNAASVGARHPIYADPRDPPRESVRAIGLHTSSSIGTARRNGLFGWAVPLKLGGTLNTGTGVIGIEDVAATSAFDILPRIQNRKLYAGETQREVDIYTLIHGTATDKMEIIASSSVASNFNSVTIGADGTAWGTVRVAVRCDGTGSNGLPESRTLSDFLDIQFRKTSGVYDDAYCVSIFVLEEEQPW
ncbi:MAG: hypothetical protein RLP02_12995 [Coleofasciculus sp. C2-GNP5-27]